MTSNYLAINFLVGYLSRIPAIKSGRSTLYTNVPMKGLICNDTGKPPVKNENISDVEFNDSSEKTLDILDIMISRDKDILKCIMIDYLKIHK